jgi:hypothetical protein
MTKKRAEEIKSYMLSRHGLTTSKWMMSNPASRAQLYEAVKAENPRLRYTTFTETMNFIFLN